MERGGLSPFTIQYAWGLWNVSRRVRCAPQEKGKQAQRLMRSPVAHLYHNADAPPRSLRPRIVTRLSILNRTAEERKPQARIKTASRVRPFSIEAGDLS